MQTDFNPRAGVDYHRVSPLFEDRLVPVNVLAQILNAGHMALSGDSFEPGGFLLLHSPERKAALWRAFGQTEVTTAPVVIAAITEGAWHRHAVLNAFAELTRTAEAIGYDTVAIESFDPQAARQEFGLRGEAEVVGLLAIGRLAKSLHRNWRAS
jgi:nitroreductase